MPYGGVQVTVGQRLAVDFYKEGLARTTVFTADVSYDGGTTWSPAQTIWGDPTLYWTVAGPATTRARLRVKVSTGPTNDGTVPEGTAFDVSDADFTIVP